MSKKNNKFNQFVNELIIRNCRLAQRRIQMRESSYGIPGSSILDDDYPTIDLTLRGYNTIYNLKFICGPSVSETIRNPEELINMLEKEDVEFVIRRKTYGKTQTRKVQKSIFSSFK